jgi:hypothetical protein
MEWKVWRRFKEFLILRYLFEKLFPGIIIPALPKKKINRSFEKIYLEKKKIKL